MLDLIQLKFLQSLGMAFKNFLDEYARCQVLQEINDYSQMLSRGFRAMHTGGNPYRFILPVSEGDAVQYCPWRIAGRAHSWSLAVLARC